LAWWIVMLPASVVRAQSSPPSSAAAMLQEGLTALQVGEVQRARELLEQVIAEQPRNGLAHYHLGRIDLEAGSLDSARGHLEVATGGSFPRVFSAWYLLGRVRLLQREFENAVGAFDGALERAPAFAPALLDRARAQLFLGRTAEGLGDLEEARALDAPAPEVSLLLAQLLVYLERAAEAPPVLESFLEQADEGWLRWRREADLLLLALGPAESAESRLAAALGADFSLANGYWALGLARLRAGRAELATTLFRAALAMDADNPVTLLLLRQLASDGAIVELPPAMPDYQRQMGAAYRARSEGRLDEAATIARRLVDERPFLVPAHRLLIEIAEQRGQLWPALAGYELLLGWLGAIPSLELGVARVAQSMDAHEAAACSAGRAVAADPEDAAAHYLLAAIQADLDDTEAALASYRRAVELGYEDVKVWLRLGELHFRRMEISESLAAYERAMAVDPEAAEAVRPFALSSLTVDQNAALRQVLERHVQAHPENAGTLYSLGVMSLNSGDVEKARIYLEHVAELEPDHRQVHYNLGQIYLRAGETERGRAEMARFRELKAAEDAEWERHNQAHFRRVEARAAMAAGDPETAIPLYRQSIAEGVAEVGDHLELAEALLQAERPAEAVAESERLLGFYPYHQEALERLAEAAQVTADAERLRDARQKLSLLAWPCQQTEPEP
jgi:tetratricopeptide (TPR) repeat protein